jgi:hypothetical protein
MSAGQQKNLVSGAMHFSQSASTLQSGNTGLTLNFWQHVIKLKRDKESFIHGTLQKYQGSEQDVCVLWWIIK